MKKQTIAVSCVFWIACLAVDAVSGDTFTPYKNPGEVPQNPTDLWKNYDPRAEDLAVKVVKEWKEDGVVTRYITFKVGTFKGADSRVAAYYSFPEDAEKASAFVWCHGGGQRAERGRGVYFAKQGFAILDVNWLGREMESGISENTDWGKVDPTQGPRFYDKALRKSWKRNLVKSRPEKTKAWLAGYRKFLLARDLKSQTEEPIKSTQESEVDPTAEIE